MKLLSCLTLYLTLSICLTIKLKADPISHVYDENNANKFWDTLTSCLFTITDKSTFDFCAADYKKAQLYALFQKAVGIVKGDIQIDIKDFKDIQDKITVGHQYCTEIKKSEISADPLKEKIKNFFAGPGNTIDTKLANTRMIHSVISNRTREGVDPDMFRKINTASLSLQSSVANSSLKKY
jgi:hypothetical protein